MRIFRAHVVTTGVCVERIRAYLDFFQSFTLKKNNDELSFFIPACVFTFLVMEIFDLFFVGGTGCFFLDS